MEEKQYPQIDDFDWDRLPILGPRTEEEAIARIDNVWKSWQKGK